jgi:dephospho-CoA kinase
VILKYEDIIVDNHGTIEELQDKVCEYLKDALDKEL